MNEVDRIDSRGTWVALLSATPARRLGLTSGWSRLSMERSGTHAACDTYRFWEVLVHTVIRVGVVGIALAIAACGREGTGPGDPAAMLDRDVALFAADAAGQDVEVMRGPGGRFGLGLGADPGSFECGTVERNGMTVTRTCVFFDKDGAFDEDGLPLAYDPVATESVMVHVEMTGSVDRGDWGSSSVNRVRDVTVTGLAGTETSATWNGSGSGTMSRIHQTRDGDEIDRKSVV